MRYIISVYKPKGISSYDVIRRLKAASGIQKIGHAGTLDPLAQGVLVIGITRDGTKQLQGIVAGVKEYLATIRLGFESTTDDAEGKKIKNIIQKKPDRDEILRVVKKFVGHIEQIPPIWSALKIHGTPAYKLARAGKKPELASRLVEIKKISVLAYRWPYLKIKAVTGPGVYIRSLARDIGRSLHVGGYLTSLERTRVGKFTKARSLSLLRAERLVASRYRGESQPLDR